MKLFETPRISVLESDVRINRMRLNDETFNDFKLREITYWAASRRILHILIYISHVDFFAICEQFLLGFLADQIRAITARYS